MAELSILSSALRGDRTLDLVIAQSCRQPLASGRRNNYAAR
jgi:hypothetical protein